MQIVNGNEENFRLIKMAHKGPVFFRDHNKDVAVMLSMQEYERITQENVNAFRKTCDAIGKSASKKGLTQKKLKQLLADDA